MMGQALIQPPPREVGGGSEDAEAKEADKQRRKIQNRKNQRAHRQRLKGKDAGARQRQHPFEVTRWRLDELEPEVHCPHETSPASETISTTHTSSSPTHICSGSSPPTTEHTLIPSESQLITHHVPSSPLDALGPFTFTFPLSSDHLLHLIQYNVLRALLTNKHSVNIQRAGSDDPAGAACPLSGLYRHDDDDNTENLFPHPNTTTTTRHHNNIPPSLAPTTLQKNHHHPIWVNALPFPRVRDNFIRHAGLFNPWDLIYDLVGEFMSSTPAACVATHPKPASAAAAHRTRRSLPVPALPLGDSAAAVVDEDDEVTARRRGLIVWGEPHEAQSWEATPGFLARWAWAVEGCEELVETSNRWRVKRGEEPMRLSVSVRQQSRFDDRQ